MTDDPCDALFVGPWLKWGQAVVHTQALEADIRVFCEVANREPLITHRTEYHPERHGFAVVVDQVLVPIPVRWSLVLGDIATNYRSALDHLAWALVSRGRQPPETLRPREQNRIKFPTNGDRLAYNGELTARLPGVRRADLAKVRSYQPYLWSSRTRFVHPLTVLTRLNNADKHRTIQPIWDISDRESARYEVTAERDCVVASGGHYVRPFPLQVDAEAAFIKVRRTGPDPYIEVQPYAESEPVLERGVPLEYWLDATRAMIFLLLVEFSAPPEDIGELEIAWDRLTIDFGDVRAWPAGAGPRELLAGDTGSMPRSSPQH